MAIAPGLLVVRSRQQSRLWPVLLAPAELQSTVDALTATAGRWVVGDSQMVNAASTVLCTVVGLRPLARVSSCTAIGPAAQR